MTKQEFLAFSLPYGLKCTANGLEKGHRLKGIFEDKYTLSNNSYGGYFSPMIENIKPIIHPLSDITKEIEHKGEKFVPIDRFNELFGYKYCRLVYYVNSGIGWYIYSSFSDTAISFDNMYLPIKKLIEWHFDIAGLIEKGEAIDVNTLSENPYK